MPANSRERAWATIDTRALKSNLNRVRQLAPGRKITAVIKANAYGHGMDQIALALADEEQDLDCFAVATLDEAVALRQLGIAKRIMLLQGASDARELAYLLESDIEFVIHSGYQLSLLKTALLDTPVRRKPVVWLKLDTGMHRLGFSPSDFIAAFTFLNGNKDIRRIVVMSHLAWADEPENPAAVALTEQQLSNFEAIGKQLGAVEKDRIEMSLAASAGIFSLPASHLDRVRPGIMLYGGSPVAGKSAIELGLQPVMTLRSRIIDIKDIPAGATVGYGATHRCEKNTRIGVVSIGYADGYPRAAPTGTPVLVRNGKTLERTSLLGRVSMDMIAIDLSTFSDTRIGDEVTLWGEGLAADEVAKFAGTLSYELFCRVTRRVKFSYL